jgi:hypothetical protein
LAVSEFLHHPKSIILASVTGGICPSTLRGACGEKLTQSGRGRAVAIHRVSEAGAVCRSRLRRGWRRECEKNASAYRD